MIKNVNDAGTTVNLAELNLREGAQERNLRTLLGAVFSSPGVAYGLMVSASNGNAVVAAGMAVVTRSGGFEVIDVPTPQTLTVPQANGSYSVYLDSDALVRLEPFIKNGTPYYRRTATTAYAPSGLPADQGVIVTAGLKVLTSGGAVPSTWVLLGTLSRSGGVLTANEFMPAYAALRGSAEVDTGGAVDYDRTIYLADLGGDVRDILDRALLKDGSRAATGHLNMGGYKVNAVSEITPAVAGQPIAANVTQLQGKTAAQIITEARAGLESTGGSLDASTLGGKTSAQIITDARAGMAPATNINAATLGGKTAAQIIADAQSGMSSGTPTAQPSISLYSVNFSQTLGTGSLMAPRVVKTNLPNGAVAAGKYYAPMFSGQGDYLGANGLELSFMPNVTYGETVVAPWQTGGIQPLVGTTLGVSGSSGAFYASLVTRISPTEAKHTLQKVVPGATSTVTVIDSVTVTLTADQITPAPVPLGVVGSVLMWADRNSGVAVTSSGHESDPNSSVLSSWVRGFSFVDAAPDGIRFKRGYVAVKGDIALIQTDTQASVLAVS